MADGRFLAGPQAKLRAKLTEKTRNRPYELVRKRMPAGTKELAAVPMLAASSRKAATAEQVQKYEEKIRSASSTFSSHHLDEGTLEEHDNYTGTGTIASLAQPLRGHGPWSRPPPQAWCISILYTILQGHVPRVYRVRSACTR